MKKIIFAFLLALSVVPAARAESGDGLAGTFGYNKLWKTSATATADTAALITSSTGAAKNTVLGYVFVDKAGSSDARVWIYDGRTSTAISKANGLQVFEIDASASRDKFFSLTISSGLGYYNTGTAPASIRILWDYTVPPRP